MPISRRAFFRPWAAKAVDRATEIDRHVRTHLLPYDFSLTDDQVALTLAAVKAELLHGEADLAARDTRQRMADIANRTVQPWREEYWKAEEARRNARTYVRDFCALEASADDLQRIRARFAIPYLTVLEDEIERRAVSWLYSLPNAQLAHLDAAGLRELVFSELKSWC
jgi:hypothetical protein